MKKLFLTIAVAATAIISAKAEEKSKTWSFGDITGINAGYNYEVYVSHGDSKEVEVVFDSALEPYLKITYSRLTGNLNLNIADLPRKMRNRELKPVKVYLEMDRISSIGLSGAAEATFDGNFNAAELDVDLSGAADVHGLIVNGTDLDIDCSGASGLNITGNFTERIDIDLSGASDLAICGDTGDLGADLSGACNMKCEGSYRFCDIACSGSSDVVVSGKADKLTFEGSGASTIQARNLEARTAEVKLTGSCTAVVNASEELHYNIARSCDIIYYGDARLVNHNSDDNIRKGN